MSDSAPADNSLAELELIHTLRGHVETRVWHVAWSPSGKTLASCGADRTIRLWAASADGDGAAWKCTAVLEEGHQRTIRCCAWSPCGRFIASCSFDGTAAVWECLDDEFDCVASLEGHENEVKAVSWSATGRWLATCGRDKAVYIWEAEDEAFEVAAVLHQHTQDVKCVAWHPSRDVLASASYDDTVRLYTPIADDWQCAQTLEGHGSTVWALAFSADGAALASVSDDRTLVLWRETSEAQYEKAAAAEAVHERTIYSVDWAAAGAGGLLATGGSDDAICVLRAEAAAADAGGGVALRPVARRERAHDTDVNAVAWAPGADGWLASAGDDGTVRLWKLREANQPEFCHPTQRESRAISTAARLAPHGDPSCVV